MGLPLVDYHNHTALCGHATGTMDDYIAAARVKGLREIGFSDHAPVPEQFRPGISMEPGQVESYITEIEKLRGQNTGIEIRVGMEVDYPLLDSFDRRYLDDPRIDYLIGSCHMLDGWIFEHPDYADGFDRRDINQVYRQYYEVLKSLAASGHFSIIGHFDVVKKFGHRPGESMTGPVTEVLSVMARKDVAMEINTSGLMRPVKEMYPSEEILHLAFQLNVPVTLGSDAPSPESVGYAFDKAAELLVRSGYRKVSGFSKKKRYDITI